MVDSYNLRAVQVITNSFNLGRCPTNEVTIYSLIFSPEIGAENRFLRRKLLSAGRSQITASIGHFFSTGNILISKNQYPDPFVVTISLTEEEKYLITVIPAGKVTEESVGGYKMYVNSCMKEMLLSLGLKQLTIHPRFYDPMQVERIAEHGLDIWKGFVASFSHHLQGLILTIDTSSKLIRQNSLLQTIQEISKSSSQNLSVQIKNALIGSIVMAKYGNFKCYYVKDVLFEENPTKVFERPEGPTTYLEYYQQRYNINITDLRQPLLQCNSEKGRKIINLVPELCVLTGITADLRQKYHVMAKIIEHTVLSPQQRLEKTVGLAKKLRNEENCRDISENFSLEIDPNPITVQGLRLPLSDVKIGKGEQDMLKIRNGSFSISTKIFHSKPINSWAVFMTEEDSKNRDLLIKMVLSKAGQIGLHMGRAYQVTYHPRDLKNLISQLPTTRETPEIILVVISNNDVHGYNHIKEACALNSGIPTQCIRANKIANPKRVDSIMMKLVLQMAAKTGSTLWKMAQNPPGIPRKTMVVGIDVFHDTALGSNNRSRSVLGFVASTDPGFTSYFNTIRIHDCVGQELAGFVGDCLREALLAFHKETNFKFLPEAIIVYRDGVGDSQIEAAKLTEVENIKSTFRLFNNFDPKLVYVLVNKRTNTKLFIRENNEIRNPQCGTLVNSVIVPDDQSFYLISHNATQGVASPTLYRIISNEKGIDLISIARLAFDLCYMYPNWTGGIKIPAPTMLAHKLAMLVGQNVRALYLEQLRMLPWFL
jgi:aubergine-like protein